MRSTLAAIVSLVAVVGAQQPPPQTTPQRPGGAQQPPPTFKVEVNYVEIDAIVTDGSGSFVRGLTRDDFQVLEQSKPQTISVFSLVDIPVERADAPLFAASPIEPDVRSNVREFEGRVFILVMDDLHVHPMRSVQVKAAAKQFVERYLGANDLAAIVTTGGSTSGAQEFTGSRRMLVRAINTFMGQKLRSATLEKLNQLPTMPPGSGGPKDPSAMERAYKARSSLGTLKNVAEYMAGIRGRRKAVVFFSEGLDYDISNPIQNRFASDVMEELKTTIAGATRANVSFYAVDPRGLGGLEDAIEIQSLPEDNSLGTHTMLDEVRMAQDTLRVIAEETGGFAAINRNDYRETFGRIIQDNSSYYVLGYYSSDDRRDGRFRPVDVRVRRPGLQVRARKGYNAPRGRTAAAANVAVAGTSPDLREALNSPIPVSGLGLTAFAAAFRGPGKKASVSVALEIEGSRFKFVERDGRITNEVEVSIVAFDSGGKPRDGGRDTVTITPRAQTRDVILKRGVRIMRRLELAPGRYHLRIGVREAGSGSVGTVMLDLEVPDFSKQGVAMSGLAITSAGASAMPTPNADALFKDVMPAPPTAVREFTRADELATFAEIYDNETRTPHRVSIKTSVIADDGTVVFTTSEERRSEELGAAGGGYGHAVKIPLKDLAPGRYVLRVEGQMLLGSRASAMRELEFRVR